MKLTIEGNIKPYFVQTLCMLYFPGENFAERGSETTRSPELNLRLTENSDSVKCDVTVTADGETETFTHTEPCKADYTTERTIKIAAGRAVYGACGALLNYKPTWGTLTGVRPSKLAMKLLREGADDISVIKSLTEDYLINETKAALALSVAHTETAVIDSLPSGACSVYISIPFCPSRCTYCSFVSYSTPRLTAMIPDYLIRLCDDIDSMFETIKHAELHVVSVYIGGGTPTILTDGQLNLLLKQIDKNLSIHGGCLREYTLEAGRPDTVTAEKLNTARSYGVTRVSVNPQTLDDRILQAIGRNHTCDDFFRAYDIARESGIKYINTDLIAGLPGDNAATFAAGIDKIIALRPDNITVHTFSVKKSADIKTAGVSPYSRSGIEAQKSVDYSQLKTKEAGYIPYYIYRQKNTVGNLENVGFSLPSCEGLYNIAIMEEIHSIFAVGAGSVTKLVCGRYAREGQTKIERLFMPKYPYEYLNMDADRDIKPFFNKIKKFLAGK
ncbi:MAG: coproporphyrinogen dehydrogenase HemZ [Eubacteriales bacterium]